MAGVTGFGTDGHVYIGVQRAAGIATTANPTDDTASFIEYRDPPALMNPQDYRGCIERFSVCTRSLPVFIPDIVPDPVKPTNPFNTAYSITINAVVPNLPDPPSAAGPIVAGVYYLSVADASFFPVLTWLPLSVRVAGSDTTPALVAQRLAAAVEEALSVAASSPILVTGSATPEGNLVLTPTQPLVLAVRDDGNALCLGFKLPMQTWVGGVPASFAFPFPCFAAPPASAPTRLITATRAVQWIPEVTGPEAAILTLPGSPLFDPAENLAYWAYDYTTFVNSVNATLVAIWEDISASWRRFASTLDFPPPFMRFKPDTTSFEMCAPPQIFGGAGYGVPGALLNDAPGALFRDVPWNPFATIVFNEPLRLLFSFPALLDSGRSGGNAQLNFASAIPAVTACPGFPAPMRPALITSASVAPPSLPTMAVLPCDFPPTGNNWSPISTIVFTSQLLGARAELVSAPIKYGQGDAGLAYSAPLGSTASTIQQITDIYPVAANAHSVIAEGIYYQPTVRRYFDITSKTPLRQIDMVVWWRHRVTGKLYPVRMSPGASVDIKFQFNALDGLL